MSKNIPQKYLKQAAMEILSTAGEAMDEYFSHLQKLPDMDPKQFETIKSRLDQRLLELQDKIFPILSKDEIKTVIEAREKQLYMPKNPVRLPEGFGDTNRSADSGASGGRIFAKTKRTDDQKANAPKPIERKEIKLSENSKKILEEALNRSDSIFSGLLPGGKKVKKQQASIIDITGKDARHILDFAKANIAEYMPYLKEKLLLDHKGIEADIAELEDILNKAGLQDKAKEIRKIYDASSIKENIEPTARARNQFMYKLAGMSICLSLEALGAGLLIGSAYVGAKSSQNPLLAIFHKGAMMAKSYKAPFVIGTVLFGITSIIAAYMAGENYKNYNANKEKLKAYVNNFDSNIAQAFEL